MKSRAGWLLPVFLLFAVSPLRSLEISDGRMKLALYEGVGRFSISYLSNLKDGSYTPLLLAADPRTSVLCIVVANKVYRMGESSEFSETAEKTATGARFTWKSALLTITETFSFTVSSGSPLSDGVRIDLSIKNISEQDLSVGARYIFDTYLGEAGFVHFKTDSLTEMARETAFTTADMPKYWVSPLAGDPDNLGLQCMTSGEGISVPDRIVFANWKRLNDSSWSYETSGSRNFNLLPYSVNDSAVAQYYGPSLLSRGSEMKITLVLGRYSASGFSARSAAQTADFSAAVQESLAVVKGIQDTFLSLRTDLSTANRILSEIDRKLASGETVTEDELALMESAVADLKERAARYTNSSGK